MSRIPVLLEEDQKNKLAQIVLVEKISKRDTQSSISKHIRIALHEYLEKFNEKGDRV